MTPGEYLRIRRQHRAESLREIVERSKEFEGPVRARSVSYFSRLEQGAVEVSREEVKYLATAYDVRPYVLDYLIPPEQARVVHLSVPEDFEVVYFALSDLPGLECRIPPSRLAGSDFGLTFITLQPGANTGDGESHPGDELIWLHDPQEGAEVYVVFPKLATGDKEKRLGKGEIIHYQSKFCHRCENRGQVSASIMVVHGMRKLG